MLPLRISRDAAYMENPMERENLEEIVSNCLFFYSIVDPGCWSFVQVPAGSVKSLAEVAAGLNLQVKDCDWIQYLISMIWLSLVAFQLWRVLEQLAPEIFLNYFFKTGDLSMVQLTQNMQKNSKKWKKTPKMHWHHTTQMVMETLVTSG